MLCGRQTPERMFDGFLTSVRGTPSDRNDPETQTAGGSQRQQRHYGPELRRDNQQCVNG
jgi:hypothetical protein